jgi:hypothetical protein
MANTIRIKRRPSGGPAGSPSPASSLYNGELAFNENDNTLYYAYGSGVGGVAQSVPAIGGSGAYSLRGGTNASGLWPISVNGNSASVTNGVYTTGNQTINGSKTFGDRSIFPSGMRVGDGSLNFSVNLLANDGGVNGPYNVYFDTDSDGPLNVAYKQSVTHIGTTSISLNRASASQTLTGVSIDGNAATVTNGVYTTGDQTINGFKTFGNLVTFNSGTSLTAINTSSNNVGYFAVFDSNPASSTQTLKSVSKSDVLDDIGGASSGIDMTAGSGLVGGGNLTASRTFNVGQGDGISVTDNAVAVDSTVVRTTGTQTIAGVKTISNRPVLNSGLSVLMTSTASAGSHFPVFISDPSSAAQALSHRTPSQVKSDIGLANVENTALSSVTFTAGSGLAGGGTLSANRSFDIGQGDGVTVSADAVAVDSTVVRTTGIQSVDGVKTFGNISIFNSGILASGTTSIRSAATASTATQFAVFTSSPASSSQSILTRTPSEVKTDIGLSNVTNDAQVKKLASTSGGFVPTWNGTTGDALNVGYSVETTLTGGAGALPRADAVKTYVDNMIVSGIATNDAMIFKGAIDCSTNPNYPAADRGWTYKVSVAGKIGGASGPVVEVNDTLICATDGTSAGTHASVGSNWTILQTNIVDASILVTGPTSATSGNIAMFNGSTGKIIKDGGFLASNIVLTTGNQSIDGDKTFNNIIYAKSQLRVGTDGFGSYTNGEVFKIASNDSNDLVTINNGTTFAGSYIYLNAITQFHTPSFGSTPLIINPTGYLSTGAITQGYWRGSTIEVNKGGTGQTSYINGQLLIGNSTNNTLSKATLTEGTGIDITNGNGTITIAHEDTSTLTDAQGSNGIASFTVDGMGHVTAVTTATYLTSGESLCSAFTNSNCTIDGGSF